MVLYLTWRNSEEYVRQLARVISTEKIHYEKKITLVDCRSTLTRYVLSHPRLRLALENVSLVTIEKPEALVEWAQNSSQDSAFTHAHLLLISPYTHLLGDFSPREEKLWMEKWEKALDRIEVTHSLHVVVMEGG